MLENDGTETGSEIPENSAPIPEENTSALNAATQSRDALSGLDQHDLFANFDPADEEDVEDYNDPMVDDLEDPEMLGGNRGQAGAMFGNMAERAFGRATSPRLYAQAAQFPTVAQLRIWRIENGIPVGLGAIECGATEEDLVFQFKEAMPKKGEGRCQYKLRPIDINGQELGKEVTLFISENHAAIQKMRRMDEASREDEDYPRQRRRRGMFDEDEGSSRHLSSMMDRMMRTHDDRQEYLHSTLEEERERMRRLRDEVANERIDLANNAAQGVQQITSKLMQEEAKRVEQAQKAQAEHSQMLLTTLTSIFSQQQTMMASQFEAQRRSDQFRLEQERQRAERERMEMEERRKRDQMEMEERRRREQQEYDRKMQAERQYLELRMLREKEESERKGMREREERERREKWIHAEQERKDIRERSAAKERELERQRRHEMMMADLKAQQTRDREHAERMMILSKQELSNKAMGGLGELLPKAGEMLKNFGMEPSDIVQRIFAPPAAEESGSMWAETLPKLLGAGADVARAVVASKAGEMPMVAPPQMMPPEMQGYPAISDELYQRKRTVPATLPQQNPYEDEEEYDDFEPDPIPVSAPEGGVISFKNTKLYSDEPAAIPQPHELATASGMDMAAQKVGRLAIRALVQKLATSKPDLWTGIITQAISAEIQIYHYIKAVSVKTALTETGAAEPLVFKIIEAMKGSGLVPSDIPYGD